ncbi:hypothetical protein BV20DRAFT_379599 [Pilatotrama ljubarskyi]|nr:hypothetical protein BV20DRAFT_379599 [Pilatotrama ljubarskyi]
MDQAVSPFPVTMSPLPGNDASHVRYMDEARSHFYRRIEEYVEKLRPRTDSQLSEAARWAQQGSKTPVLIFAAVLPLSDEHILRRAEELTRTGDSVPDSDSEDIIFLVDCINSRLDPNIQLEWVNTLVIIDPRTRHERPTCGMLKMFSNQDDAAKRDPYVRNMGEILKVIKETLDLKDDVEPMWHFDSDIYGFEPNGEIPVDEMLEKRRVCLDALAVPVPQ